jgi:hypothetical protein
VSRCAFEDKVRFFAISTSVQAQSNFSPMNWRRALIAAILSCVPLAGRAQTSPSGSPVSPRPVQSSPAPAAVYGAYPNNYQELITAWLNAALVDPSGVKIKWLGEPRPGELAVTKGRIVSGYLVDFSVNARNIFGAFTGDQKHTALIRDGQVVTATGFVAR